MLLTFDTLVEHEPRPVLPRWAAIPHGFALRIPTSGTVEDGGKRQLCQRRSGGTSVRRVGGPGRRGSTMKLMAPRRPHGHAGSRVPIPLRLLGQQLAPTAAVLRWSPPQLGGFLHRRPESLASELRPPLSSRYFPRPASPWPALTVSEDRLLCRFALFASGGSTVDEQVARSEMTRSRSAASASQNLPTRHPFN
jgi:hypothetical protein